MNPEYKNIALIIVDVQLDFMTGGSLQVGANNESEKILGFINGISPKYGTVVATQDYHPANHCSFPKQGGPWPIHCVQGKRGSNLHPKLNLTDVDIIIRKGTSATADSYSGFKDDDGKKTGLAGFLKERKVKEVHVVGLATNFCVKATAIHAQELGLKVVVLLPGCCGVELAPAKIHVAPALAEMRKLGIELVD